MTGCEITKGRDIPCKEGAAGLLAVYFLNKGFKVVYDGNLISDITNSEGQAVDVFKYELDNVGNTFDETVEATPDNGTFYNNQTLTLALQTLQDDDLPEIQNLAKGRPAAIVQYRNGKTRLAGISRGMDTSGGNNSGGDLGDFQGFNLTMVAKETNFAPVLKGYTLDDPFAGLSTTPNVIGANPDQS